MRPYDDPCLEQLLLRRDGASARVGTVRNGSEWFGMVRNGSEWFGTVRNVSDLFGVVRNRPPDLSLLPVPGTGAVRHSGTVQRVSSAERFRYGSERLGTVRSSETNSLAA